MQRAKDEQQGEGQGCGRACPVARNPRRVEAEDPVQGLQRQTSHQHRLHRASQAEADSVRKRSAAVVIHRCLLEKAPPCLFCEELAQLASAGGGGAVTL